MPRLALITVLVFAVSGCAPSARSAPGEMEGAGAYRVYDVASGEFVSLAEVVAAGEDADVLFFGEFHDDPAAHEAERDLMELLAESDREVVFGLEMFERDVQSVLDAYLDGTMDEAEFLAGARPWPNYTSDYRPLVEIARRKNWRVVATNLPQELASLIARSGLGALDNVPTEQRVNAAARISCPEDDYWERFIEVIGATDDSAAHGATLRNDPMLRTTFEAQCARDETMAETIAEFVGSGRLVVHVNGAFHTEYFLGIIPRLLRRNPGAVVTSVLAVPVDDLSNPPLTDDTDRADFVIFTPCTAVTDC